MQPYNLHWSGMLTTGNIEQVHNLFHELLDGKFYTSINAHPTVYPKIDEKHPETMDCRMHVRTSQKLTPEGVRGGDAITFSVDGKYAHLAIHDTYGIHMMDTKLEGEHAHYDHTYQNPYIVFEYNRVTIHHRAPAGNLLVWAFAVEDHSE